MKNLNVSKNVTTLNKNYLFDENKNINGSFYYFKTINTENPNKIKTKMFLVNCDISAFNKMLDNYCYVMAQVLNHSDKKMRKDNKQFKQIAIKKVLRFFKNMKTRTSQDTVPLKANEIRLILNEFFGIKMNGYIMQKQLNGLLSETSKQKITTTTTERTEQKELKNSLYSDLFFGTNTGKKNKNRSNSINDIRRKTTISAITEYKKLINFLKNKPTENNKKLIAEYKNRINVLRQMKPRKINKDNIPSLDVNKAYVLNRTALNILNGVKVNSGYSLAKIDHVSGYTA